MANVIQYLRGRALQGGSAVIGGADPKHLAARFRIDEQTMNQVLAELQTRGLIANIDGQTHVNRTAEENRSSKKEPVSLQRFGRKARS